MPPAVFLDLYGVLADSFTMEPAYNRRMAEIVARRFGGDVDRWREIQLASFAWYQAEGRKLDARPGPEREGDRWVDAVAAMNAGQIEWMFRSAGLPVPADAARLADELEAETVRGIDALYPDVEPILHALRDAGFRVFLSTNANRSNAESALIGGGVRDLFDGLVMLETAKAKKDRPYYWERAFELAGASPRESVVLDDEPRYLATVSEFGARCVQVSRPPRAGREPHPIDPLVDLRRQRGPGGFPVIDSLAALPALLRD